MQYTDTAIGSLYIVFLALRVKIPKRVNTFIWGNFFDEGQ